MSAPFGPVTIISPHLDDAVFSCGSALSTAERVTIVTVCAGIPPAGTPPSHFDETAGFSSAAEAMTARREEDHAAAALLGCAVVHLDCLSDEYDRSSPGRDTRVYEASRAALVGAEGLILVPLGLRHPDHVLVARACRLVPCAVYEELPYRTLWPKFVGPALLRAGRTSPLVAPAVNAAGLALKARAVATYASQLIGMNVEALSAHETYHMRAA